MKSKRLFVCIAFLLIFWTNSVCASGIPVVDAAGIAQSVAQYIVLIMEYSELITQTGLQGEQLVQQVEQYAQTLREYQHYLNQIKALRNYMSDRDWQQLMREINMYYRYYGNGDMSTIPTMNRESRTYEGDVDAVFGRYGYTPREPKDIEAEARALGIRSSSMTTDINREWSIYQKQKDRARMISANEKKAQERDENLKMIDDALTQLDNASDLATLQLMATQNQVLLNQMNSLLRSHNQHMLLMESQEELRSSRKAEARDQELKRLKEREQFQGGKSIQKWGGY